jgi:hypothetical protein
LTPISRWNDRPVRPLWLILASWASIVMHQIVGQTQNSIIPPQRNHWSFSCFCYFNSWPMMPEDDQIASNCIKESLSM